MKNREKKMFPLLLVMILVLLSLSESKTGKICQNPSGKNVDWYIVLLFPETATKERGLYYGYFDNTSTELAYYKYEDSSFPGIKVVQGFEDGKTNYFFWNDDQSTDDDSKSASSGKAHSKGGLIFNDTEGLLFSHSLPRFPRRKDDNTILDSLPLNGGVYGQHFICISMDKTNILKVVESLNIINPPMMINVEQDLTQTPPNPMVEKLIKNRQDSKLPVSQISEITSIGGQKFQIFSKGRNNPSLPYDLEIPEYYKDGLYVETWTKPDMLPSICKGENKILNVLNLNFGVYNYDKNQEHSKWAVATKKNICCFGDLNRTESQKKRGGNIICFENKKLATIMRAAIVASETCQLKFLS
jgi:deoxyribonuclease-2